MRFTFKELLEKYNVVIPQLQRDYAQGREIESDLRRGFILKIKSTLSNEILEVMNLDFIYGYTEIVGKEKENFIPLDGQQRLTTLWLLYWYLSPRIKEVSKDYTFYYLNNESMNYLQNFSYETRVSSKRFCECLINESLSIEGYDLLSEKIFDSPWYMSSWSNDPTIKSILTMLDTIQENINDRETAWYNLIQGKITFDYIDIKSDEFRLTDELYIKMNSRGKPLSDFENFKALFCGILSGKSTEYINEKKIFENTEVSYQDYFAFKIDGEWLDLFWKYRNEIRDSIDNCILNYLYFVSEFLFYRYDGDDRIYNGILPKRDIDFLGKVFSVKENIDFLFDSLDFLSGLDSVSNFFSSLFENIDTFDNYGKNYFLRCITNIGFEVKDKTIFYALLIYTIKTNFTSINDSYKEYIRIVRNLLNTVRQPNPHNRIEYISNLRLPNVSDYCSFIDGFISLINSNPSIGTYQILAKNEFMGFTRDSIRSEKYKAKAIIDNPEWKNAIHSLEENSNIQGNTINFNFEQENTIEKIEAYLSLWSSSTKNSLLVRAFLCYGDYSVMTHSRSSIGSIRYFGIKGNWGRILTATEKNERKKVSLILDKFLTDYINNEEDTNSKKLENIIANYKADLRDWRYYFITYSSITKNNYGRKLNLFSCLDDERFEISQLGNAGKQPLHSYHLNSYEIALRNEFKDNNRIILYYGRFSDLSYIKIDEKIRIESTRLGWQIYLLKDIDEACKVLFDKYRLSYDLNASIILKETEKKDRIQIAISFILDILNLNY
ncbi:DUF262 domain-containing protein [Flavobacterium sp. C4GT6]|uniref:DUF262 domain-containing protein n=1 Tax=Flavobacterium sp. C4GT6 TaxID=3103818 RepID=UPI002ED4B6A4